MFLKASESIRAGDDCVQNAGPDWRQLLILPGNRIQRDPLAAALLGHHGHCLSAKRTRRLLKGRPLPAGSRSPHCLGIDSSRQEGHLKPLRDLPRVRLVRIGFATAEAMIDVADDPAKAKRRHAAME